jgi:hypothetical protein
LLEFFIKSYPSSPPFFRKKKKEKKKKKFKDLGIGQNLTEFAKILMPKCLKKIYNFFFSKQNTVVF